MKTFLLLFALVFKLPPALADVISDANLDSSSHHLVLRLDGSVAQAQANLAQFDAQHPRVKDSSPANVVSAKKLKSVFSGIAKSVRQLASLSGLGEILTLDADRFQESPEVLGNAAEVIRSLGELFAQSTTSFQMGLPINQSEVSLNYIVGPDGLKQSTDWGHFQIERAYFDIPKTTVEIDFMEPHTRGLSPTINRIINQFIKANYSVWPEREPYRYEPTTLNFYRLLQKMSVFSLATPRLVRDQARPDGRIESISAAQNLMGLLTLGVVHELYAIHHQDQIAGNKSALRTRLKRAQAAFDNWLTFKGETHLFDARARLVQEVTESERALQEAKTLIGERLGVQAANGLCGRGI